MSEHNITIPRETYDAMRADILRLMWVKFILMTTNGLSLVALVMVW